VLKLIV